MSLHEVRLLVDHDADADAVYVHLGPVAARVAHRAVVEPLDVGGLISIDLDEEGRVVGIEVRAAQAKVHPALLAATPKSQDDIGTPLPPPGPPDDGLSAPASRPVDRAVPPMSRSGAQP